MPARTFAPTWVQPALKLLLVSARGYVRLEAVSRVVHGVRHVEHVTFGVTPQTGPVVGFLSVGPLDDVEATTRAGRKMRVEVCSIGLQAALVDGHQPRVFDLADDDIITAVVCFTDPDGILTAEVGKAWRN